MDATTSSPTRVVRAAPPARDGIAMVAMRSLRQHRTSVVASLLLFALCAGSALVLIAQLTALDPSAACWEGWYASGETGGPGGCGPQIQGFYRAADPGGFLTEALGVLAASAAGLLLVVPVTARAARGGSTTDGRTLLGQLLPMLLIGIAGFALLGFLFGVLRGLILEWSYLEWGGGRRMQVQEMGYEGITFVARGFLVMGVGALLGGLLRRPAAAFALAVGLILGHTLLVVPVLRFEVAKAVATPVSGPEHWNIGYVVTYDRLPDGSLKRVVLVAEPETYTSFFTAEMVISLGVGGACLLLTVPVVARRRRH